MANIELTTSYKKISSFNLTYGTINTYAKITSSSVTNLQDIVTLQSRFTLGSGWASYSFDSATAKLDGTTKSYTSRTTFSSGTTTIQTKQNVIIPHNADGSSQVKSITTSWTASFGGSGSATANIVGPKMDVYPILTDASDITANLSNDSNIQISTPSISYTTSTAFEGANVTAGIFDTQGNALVPYRQVTNLTSGGTYEFTNLSSTEKNNLVTTCITNSANIIYKLKTIKGGTEYDPSTKQKTITITNGNPSYSRTKEETNAKVITLLDNDDSASTIIKNASKVKLTITATAKPGSTISSVSVYHNGIIQTQTEPKEGTTNQYEFLVDIVDNKIGYLITDSRGNTNTGTPDPELITIPLIEYVPVNIISLEPQRISGLVNDDIRVRLTSTYNQLTINSQANAPIIKWRFAGGSYTTIPSSAYTIDTANNQVSINYLLSEVIPHTDVSELELYIEDFLSTDSEKRNIIKLIGIFERGEHDVQVNGDLYIADENRQNKVNVLEAINGIVESGSNSNGYYTKFANGFMICMIKDKSIARQGTSTLGGASVNYGGATWTFPTAFTSVITCIATAVDSGSGVFGAEIDGTITTTGVPITCYGANTTYKVNAIAFGMWK